MALWGKTDADASRPKYLNSADLAKAIFVDETEAALAANKKRGVKGAGWYLFTSYTDSAGETRYKAEKLVAMRETALAAGDRADDATAADVANTITISSQPANQDTSSGAATFSVTASVTNSGSLVYQWQKKVAGSTRWANVSGATSDSLALTGQLAANDGDQYRVKITSSNGAPEVTSTAAELNFVS